MAFTGANYAYNKLLFAGFAQRASSGLSRLFIEYFLEGPQKELRSRLQGFMRIALGGGKFVSELQHLIGG